MYAVRRPCFMCGQVQILLAGHKVCADCHRPDVCRICNEYERPARVYEATHRESHSGRRIRHRTMS